MDPGSRNIHDFLVIGSLDKGEFHIDHICRVIPEVNVHNFHSNYDGAYDRGGDAVSSGGFRVSDDKNRKCFRNVGICMEFHGGFFHKNDNDSFHLYIGSVKK